MRLARLDVVGLANLALWAAIAWAFARAGPAAQAATQHGRPNLAELLLYASVLIAVFALVWPGLRRFAWHPALLAALQACAIAGLAGLVVFVRGVRLYDCAFASIPYDKIVHFTVSLTATLAVGAILNAFGARPRRLAGAVIVLVVLGGGALWEIVEYLTVKAYPEAGVGAYDNNMQDLAANLLGGLASRLLPARWREALERVPTIAPRAGAR